MPSDTSNPVLVIDGECAMCNVFARFVDRFSPDCRFMCAQHEKTVEVLQVHGITAEDALTSIVLIQDGQVFRGSDAFAQTLMRMNVFFLIIGFVLWLVPRFIREFVYSLVANNRYSLFGKRDACSIPSATFRKKFLHPL